MKNVLPIILITACAGLLLLGCPSEDPEGPETIINTYTNVAIKIINKEHDILSNKRYTLNYLYGYPYYQPILLLTRYTNNDIYPELENKWVEETLNYGNEYIYTPITATNGMMGERMDIKYLLMEL